MKKSAFLVVMAVIAVLAPATQSSAAPPGEPGGHAVPVQAVGRVTPAEKAQQEEAAFRSDSAAIAQQTNRPFEEVHADLLWQREVTREAQRLEQENPETFTGLRILSHEDRSVWVGFKGAAPEVALPADTQSTVASDQPMNQTQIRQAAAEAARRARATFGAESIAVPDIVDGSIDVTVAKAKPADANVAIGRLTTDTFGVRGSSARLDVVFDPQATSGLETATGGAKLEYASTASLQCTSAFPVIKNGATGMLTAQHCNSAFTHENYDGATEYSAWTVMSTYGGLGDLRWYNTSTTELPQFRADYSDLRNLYGAPGFSEGQWMCHFGYGNGKSCDTVYRTGVSANGASGLVAMSNHYTTGGNSGGPWFWGGDGYGVHHGYTTIWFKGRALFTPLNRVMPAFGAYILVN